MKAVQAIEIISKSCAYRRLKSLFCPKNSEEDRTARRARIKMRINLVLQIGKIEIPKIKEQLDIEQESLFEDLVTERLPHFSCLWPAVKAGVFKIEQ